MKISDINKNTTFEDLQTLEQPVADNSEGFRYFLKKNDIEYINNGHITTVIGNHDLFTLGKKYGVFMQECMAKGINKMPLD